MIQILYSLFFTLLFLFLFVPIVIYILRPNCLAGFCNQMVWDYDYRIKYCRNCIVVVFLMYLLLFAVFRETASWDDGVVMLFLFICWIRPAKPENFLRVMRDSRVIFLCFLSLTIGLSLDQPDKTAYVILFDALVNASLFYPSENIRNMKAEQNGATICNWDILTTQNPGFLVENYFDRIGMSEDS